MLTLHFSVQSHPLTIHPHRPPARLDVTQLEVVKEVTKLLHNASLLIDDIQDNSKLRRGNPVAHAVFGVATTINSANYVYFHCLDRVAALGDPRAVAVFTKQLLELHRGQGMDIYWRDAVVCPSEQQYKDMVLRKTGGLFGLAVELMQPCVTHTLFFHGEKRVHV